jgi:hypothetical protein
MERITEIEVLRLVGSNALSVRGTEQQLSDGEFHELNLLCRQMQAYYPHQEFADETVQGYQFDLERLSVLYGLGRVRTVLLNIRIKPGQKFFPHPSEVSEALEDLLKAEKAKAREANPYIPCGRCTSGMVIVEKHHGRFAERCTCWLAWKSGVPVEDRKSKSGGNQ